MKAETSATTRVPEVNVERRNRNDELFVERGQIMAELESLPARATGRPHPSSHRLRRQLDEITQRIVDSNQGLVHSYVKRFTSNASSDDAAEFTHAGMLGLMHAVATYQVGKGTFAQWAYKRIQCEVLKSVRATDHPTISAGDFERRPAILSAARKLQGDDVDYQPSYTEIAAAADATVDQVRRVLEAPTLTSISTPMGHEVGGTTLGDTIPDAKTEVDHEVLTGIDIDTLERYGLSHLDARELFVVARRWGLDGEPQQHLSAIGTILGLSREAVRQIEAKALSKLRHPIVLRQLVRQGRGYADSVDDRTIVSAQAVLADLPSA